jgi:predicted metal-dependent HD superfamily phosphohydrolase
MSMLKDNFEQLFKKYDSSNELKEELWVEIEEHYSRPSRHYHNLSHLENMFSQLKEVRLQIKDWDAIVFALFYHDIIYKTSSNNNEERSAELAISRLLQTEFPPEQINKCKEAILATKVHEESVDADINYFTDADLCILGMNWSTYSIYTNNVRNEYALYPELLYKPGRKKVLKQFLSMNRIFKTDFFYSKFEQQAGKNVLSELNTL